MRIISDWWKLLLGGLLLTILFGIVGLAILPSPFDAVVSVMIGVSFAATTLLLLVILRMWLSNLDSRTLERSVQLEARMGRKIRAINVAPGVPTRSLEVMTDSVPFVNQIGQATRALGMSASYTGGDCASDVTQEGPEGRVLVTVIVALYNETDYLEAALASIANQTLDNFRCLVVDDASTNDAAAIAERFAERDPRFEVIRSQTNGGAAAARNIGLALTETPYVAFLDSDDMLLADSLETRVLALHAESDPLVGAVFGGIQQIPENASSSMAEITRSWKLKPNIDFVLSSLDAPFNSHAPLFRSDALRIVGGFREHMRQSMEDWECWMRILRSGYYFKSVGHFVGLYRNKLHSASRADLSENLANSHVIFDSMNRLDQSVVGPGPYRRPHSEYRVEFHKGLRSLHFAAMQATQGSISGVDEAIATIDPEVVPSLLRSVEGPARIRSGISRGLAADPRTWRNIREIAEPIAEDLENRLRQRGLDRGKRVVEPTDREVEAILVAQSHGDVHWIESALQGGVKSLVLVTEQATGDMNAGQALDAVGIEWETLGEFSLDRVAADMIAVMLPLYGAAQRLLEEAKAAEVETLVFENAFGIEAHELANLTQPGVPFEVSLLVQHSTGKMLRSAESRIVWSARDVRPEEQLVGMKSDDIGRFRDLHVGERCFVIGNGPSLNKLDLTQLATEYTFAVNGIFYAKDQMGFDPTYYVVEDSSVMNENLNDIRAYVAGHKFFPTIYRGRYGPPEDNVTFYMMNRGFYESTSPNYSWPRFSADAEKRIFSGQSVTCTSLQLAYYMGFSEVIMIGVDFSYQVPADAPRTGDTITSLGADPNHFHPDYFGKGKTYKDPRLDRVLRSFQVANAMYQADGREVVNATAGGELEVFRRASFDSFFD